ncbi:hypothetical protein CANTEDRAFT_102787 [Yamadazyma tenuis ATCC 10573]|uniref:Major facilitator superfamily (MFS) profile domain-containing protein n=1 Tax=Candida tenuis (strain ATCC 10573 / BCRC 21748 / CBS 615 / JCM 9827 / NBRC 10315 / NRRL Y-1498 / VKM Y-70) TaxID=590646 RepID=G3B0R1_CANTC|nr:uncharacterized protein CANTEDRAFT_102787 [Yamadazyma tenuis ATCC 10573]EGV65454.1 hypothetical protein CANTEDRAFT_102787 [Yamadazyma tenuis ATCC 10573]
MTPNNPPKNIWRMLAVCFFMLICGASDATPGVVLPEIESYYKISYGVVSIIWVGNAFGFILVACISHKMESWFNHRNLLLIGTGLAMLMYAIVSSGTKYPVIVIGFFFGGAGLAINLSKSNVFMSRFGDKSATYLSYAQCCYGVGATVSPLIATAFVSSGIKFHFFYLVLLGCALTAFVLFFLSFSGAETDLAPWEAEYRDENKGSDKDHRELLKASLKNKVTWLMALFTFFYQGAEVAVGGWIVTYLIDYRGGRQSVGYVASGFWSGVALGRLFLTRPLYKWVGPRRSVFICSLTAMVFIGLTWAVPSIIAAGVLVSLAGFFVGPNYPTMLKLASDMFPRKIHIISLTITTAFGSSGGAFFPFIIGMAAQKLGAFVVLPGFLILYTLMLAFWVALPNKDRRIKDGDKFGLWQRIW